MRELRLAEAILALVAPRDRAAAAIGDLMEARGGPSRWRLWVSVARIGASFVREQVVSAPFAMAATAVLGWFAYMLMALLLTMAFAIAATVVWGLLYVAANHTGLELVVDALSLEQPDGFAPPGQLIAWVQLIAMWLVAPYQTGRLAARRHPGREVAIGLVLTPVWAVLAIAAPLVIFPGQWSPPRLPALSIATGTTASALALTLIVLCVLCGAVRERQLSNASPAS